MENQGSNVTVSIRFVSGKVLELSLFRSGFEQFTGGTRTSEFLNSQMLPFEIDGVLHLYPVSSIESITLDPAPPGKPLHIMGGLKSKPALRALTGK